MTDNSVLPAEPYDFVFACPMSRGLPERVPTARTDRVGLSGEQGRPVTVGRKPDGVALIAYHESVFLVAADPDSQESLIAQLAVAHVVHGQPMV